MCPSTLRCSVSVLGQLSLRLPGWPRLGRCWAKLGRADVGQCRGRLWSKAVQIWPSSSQAWWIPGLCPNPGHFSSTVAERVRNLTEVGRSWPLRANFDRVCQCWPNSVDVGLNLVDTRLKPCPIWPSEAESGRNRHTFDRSGAEVAGLVEVVERVGHTWPELEEFRPVSAPPKVDPDSATIGPIRPEFARFRQTSDRMPRSRATPFPGR